MVRRATAWWSFGSLVLLLAGCAAPRATQPADGTQPAVVQPAPVQPIPLQPDEPKPTLAAEPNSEPAPEVPQDQPSQPAPTIALAGGITVDRAARRVLVPARIATRFGFLEQVACARDSREHESLVVVDVKASAVHAALLLVGAEPGRPGRWRLEEGVVVAEPPEGPRLRVFIQVSGTADAPAREWPVTDWIRGVDGRRFDAAWVFAGSRFADNPRSWKEPGQHYVADFTGSIVGLVTFGDETVAATSVIPDLIDISAANWEAWTERMPDEETPVVLILELEEPSGASLPASGPSGR